MNSCKISSTMWKRGHCWEVRSTITKLLAGPLCRKRRRLMVLPYAVCYSSFITLKTWRL